MGRNTIWRFISDECGSGRKEARRIIRAVKKDVKEIALDLENLSERDMRLMKKHILPRICLYRELIKPDGVGLSKSDAFMVLDRYLAGDSDRIAAWFSKLEKFPFFFLLFTGRMADRAVKNPWWMADVVQDDKEGISFNVTGCMWMDCCAHCNTPELSTLMCRHDTWTWSQMKKISFTRTRTLAEDYEFCDFTYLKKT